MPEQAEFQVQVCLAGVMPEKDLCLGRKVRIGWRTIGSADGRRLANLNVRPGLLVAQHPPEPGTSLSQRTRTRAVDPARVEFRLPPRLSRQIHPRSSRTATVDSIARTQAGITVGRRPPGPAAPPAGAVTVTDCAAAMRSMKDGAESLPGAEVC